MSFYGAKFFEVVTAAAPGASPTPQEALTVFLLADGNLTALLAKDTNGTPALYPDGSVPEDTGYPRITYQVIDWPIKDSLGGTTGYGHPRIQLDIRAKGPTGYGQAWAVEEAVRKSQGGDPLGPRLNGYHGILAGVDVRRVRLVDRHDQREDPIHGEEYPVRRVTLDFVVELVEG